MKTLVMGPKKRSILSLATKLRDVPGAFAELGVYQGGMLAALAEAHPAREVFGFDTFTGLPREAWREGEPHKIGDFADSSLEFVRQNTARLPNVRLVQGIFPQSAAGLAHVRFALVHIDFDYYQSTKDAIEWIRPRMNPKGVMIFDDYDWPYCPGVKQAIEEAGLSVTQTTGYQVACWI